MHKHFGVIMSGGKSGIGQSAVAQVFVLVRTNGGQWTRHEIANDNVKNNLFWNRSRYGSLPFDKLVDVLQPLTNCEVFFRKYSVEYCFDQQRAE
jgi:hypothetical protein